MSIRTMPEDCLWQQIAVMTVPFAGAYAGIQTLSGLFKRVQNLSGAEEMAILKVMKQYNLCISVNGFAYGLASLGLAYTWGSFAMAGIGVTQLLIGGDQLLLMNASESLIKLIESTRMT